MQDERIAGVCPSGGHAGQQGFFLGGGEGRAMQKVCSCGPSGDEGGAAAQAPADRDIGPDIQRKTFRGQPKPPQHGTVALHG